MSTKDTKRERLAKELAGAHDMGSRVSIGWGGWSRGAQQGWLGVADYILAREEKRESAMLRAATDAFHVCLGNGAQKVCDAIYAAYAELDAEPEPTLAEAVKDFLAMWPEHGDALKGIRAALARERAKEVPR